MVSQLRRYFIPSGIEAAVASIISKGSSKARKNETTPVENLPEQETPLLAHRSSGFSGQLSIRSLTFRIRACYFRCGISSVAAWWSSSGLQATACFSLYLHRVFFRNYGRNYSVVGRRRRACTKENGPITWNKFSYARFRTPEYCFRISFECSCAVNDLIIWDKYSSARFRLRENSSWILFD